MDGITKIVKLYDADYVLKLECGLALNRISVAYETHGRLNEAGTNAILICHALTGDAHVAGEGVYNKELLDIAPLLAQMKPGQSGWWDGMVGPGKVFDTSQYFVICSNILGSCYGTTGPVSINPATGKTYKNSFPPVTVRDMVEVQSALLRYLGVKKISLITGGSLGGMQVLEWALMYPEMVSSIVPIATAAQHSAWCIGLNHLAREAIINDPTWDNGNYDSQPSKGLALARKIGMVSYRSDQIFNSRFARDQISDNGQLFDNNNIFQVESYLKHQGVKLVKRFDANCYLKLTYAMDQHDVSRGRGTIDHILGSITAKTLCIGINSDILYPAHEQQQIARLISNAHYAEIDSPFGHDAFLIEFDKLGDIITPFLNEVDR
jgi:homoserine O-acetyltransferase